ncbi:PREDICTED: uncharacterized protein LOC100636542 [Amphimedon queenslandica]|uniref:histone acetyltransferase n=2 Tax=Amphimedon queenslandica TaxID=400682 RepID=A0AAN0JDR4_AMPQE|nr:PREDICTED: uncharacterized protein LOC100636542 [Amphimedon queenslandica]|eukprot:XP_019854901.1 PREDICTED: uncharacterized protein LOC100636542 [Amphimedon queenslandica]
MAEDEDDLSADLSVLLHEIYIPVFDDLQDVAPPTPRLPLLVPSVSTSLGTSSPSLETPRETQSFRHYHDIARSSSVHSNTERVEILPDDDLDCVMSNLLSQSAIVSTPVVSTSGDPTPTLPSISSFPSHLLPPSSSSSLVGGPDLLWAPGSQTASSLPSANPSVTDSPYQDPYFTGGVQQQQQMPQLPPVMGGGQPSYASNDPEKRKLIQQQLVLLLHAHRCQQREKEQQAQGEFRPCTLPHCRTMKNVLNHMTECQAGRNCPFPHCASSRQIIYHWKNCNQQDCLVCSPLKNTIRPNVGGSIGGVPNSMFGSEVPPVSLPPLPVPTATGNMPPSQNPSQPQTAKGGGVNPNPMGSAVPPPIFMGPKHDLIPFNRAWRAEVNLDIRNHLIKKLVEAIYHPVPNPSSTHDSRVKSLFQYATKVENMMFENASSREDYYQKLAERIYCIRKELDEKRKMNKLKSDAPTNFPDDGPHTMTDVPDIEGQPSPFTDTTKILKEELISSTSQSLLGGATKIIKTKLKIDDSELYTKGSFSPSDDSSSSKQPLLTVKKEEFSPLSSTFLPFSPPVFCDEKKPAVSKIKEDSSLVKIFTPDEIENALMPVFNEVIKQEPESYPFRQPVNPIDLGIPDYFDVIKNPIDLSVIRMKLESGSYSDPWQFCDDMQLMFDNAWTYNKKTSRVYKFCSKLHEVFYETIDEAMVSLGYCCGQKYFFHARVLYCDGKSCPIPRDSVYYNYKDIYAYCTKCFTETPGDSVTLSLDDTSNISLPKGVFKQIKNDTVEIEPMVECIHCRRSFHKICVLHHDEIWPEGYQCSNCLQSLKTSRADNRFVAKRLPTTKLGLFLEERVNSFLKAANVPEAEVTIRVLSSSNKLLDTGSGMMDRFSYFPSQFPYRTKALFAFEEIDGAEVCFFGMHVQEYGSDCPAPNTRHVYISYLDALPFFKPVEYQTFVNHEIVLGYLEFCKRNGFQTAHLWASLPAEDYDYIFYCRPMDQDTTKPKRLVEWYRNMLEKGKAQSVLCDFQDIFQYCVKEEITHITDIPYFEGDFWPNVIEETIKELDQEGMAPGALSVDVTIWEKEKERVTQQYGTGSQKADSDKGSKKASSGTKKRKKGSLSNYNPLVSGDNLTQKIYQTMGKHKEVFFVAHLQPPKKTIVSLPTTSDPDSLVTCKLMDGYGAFLNLARENHWEFSSLRRAKFSTMSMLYELHNQGDSNKDNIIYCCNNCGTDIEFRWHCKECEDYNLCSTCYYKIGHEHSMERLGFSMEDKEPKSSSASTTFSRLEIQQRRNEFLIHACQCKDSSCSKQLCIKMKQLLRHARDCKMRTSGKCSVCNFFIKLCAAHAQECHEVKCPVPLCASLKKQTRERQMKEQARNIQLADQRIKVMSSHSSPFTTPSEPNPGSSSPNVIVQPQGSAMQSPLVMENNIQKLVQAICSPSPQDNLKAKEYLRTHTELVPQVIQGLQYLSRDKEVSYLQQEFGNYVSRPPHPQQSFGGGAYMSPQVRPQVPMQPMQPMQRPMTPSSNTMMPNHYHYPGGNPHMTHNRMPYQGQPMAGLGHSHLQYMRHQYSSYDMQVPPPQYEGGQPMADPYPQHIFQHLPSHSMQPPTDMGDNQLNDSPGRQILSDFDIADLSSFPLHTGLSDIPRKKVSKRIVTKWLKEGSVELTVTRINIQGPPGSGKTCALHLLLNEDPPTDHVTDSTPIACPTFRATRVSIDNLKWEKVTGAHLLEKLASDLNVAAASQPKEHIETTSLSYEQQSEEDAGINETVVLNSEASSISSNDETETLIQKILDTIQRSAVQLSDHWLYIIDSGSQPAYQELLPLFIKTAFFNIITLDLSQPLDKNREFFQSAVFSGTIFKLINVPYVSGSSFTKHFVLGTHYDVTSQDTLKKIDEELRSSMNHNMQGYVSNKGGESIIFPVNTLTSVDEGRMEARQKLCESITDYEIFSQSVKIKMPIRWFTFALWLQKVGENKSRDFLIIDEVVSAGKRFKMSEKDTKDALQYLHSVTIVLYFPDILPRLVFIDPQPILKILSHLLALTYVQRTALHLIANPVPLDEDINKLCNTGFFQEKLLYHLKSDVKVFFPPHFEPSHLIRLLIHLCVITKGKEGDYFFPYALQSYTNLSVPQTETKPLLIVWKLEKPTPHLPVPGGIFPQLITHLLNQNELSFKVEFPPLQPQYYRYRDALSLWISIKGKRYTLHIINRYTHIEVYYNGSTKEAKENCPYIREVVMAAVDTSADAINIIPSHSNAFFCPKKKNCYCVVEENYFVNCTLCTRSADISEDDDSYWCWFGLTDFQPKAVTSDSKYLQALDIQVLDEILTDMKEGRLSVQFDYLIPQTDSLDSSVLIAGQKLFILQGDRSQSLQWEKYGFRLECPQGAVSKDTEVAVTAIAGGNFKVPKGTMLVSAVYAISVSKPLLKPLVIELQHCVDLKYESQTRCLKFVSGPLKHPYQLSLVEGGGSFSIGNRFGSIKRDTFSFNGIVAEMSDGDTHSDGGTPSEGSDDEDADTDSSKEVMEMDEGPPVDIGTIKNGATKSENIATFRKRKGSESITDDLPLKKTSLGQNDVQDVSSTNEQDQEGSLSRPISISSATLSSDSNSHISQIGGDVNSEKNVTHSAMLYTGMMYYEEKNANHWIAIYSVVQDLDVLIQYCNKNHPLAEKDFVVDTFNFIEPNGSIQLILSNNEQEGWTVHASREQMKLLKSTIDNFSSNPLYSSFSMNVHAKVGVAQDPLHYPIDIIGIDPEKTVFINRHPPPSTYIISPTTTTPSIQTEEGVTYISEIASKVITDNALLIKGCGINLLFLVDKLLENEIINAREKREITDNYSRQTADERMDELLHIISSSINMDGNIFGIFLNILRKEGTRRTNALADKLIGKYKNLHKTE